MFAVVKFGDKQYKVAENDVIKVDGIQHDQGEELTMDKVLSIGGEGVIIKIGAPFVAGAKVSAEVVIHDRDKKVIIFKMEYQKLIN